jgi:hypothetical protein
MALAGEEEAWMAYHNIFRNAAIVAPLAFLLSQTSFAQKLVDPDKVAPEYREAAVKRRAEQIKMLECDRKANGAKVLPRDRAAFIEICLDQK